MKSLLSEMLQEAMRLTRAGHLHEATRAIQRALQGRLGAAPSAPSAPPQEPAAPAAARAGSAASGLMLEGCVFEAPAQSAGSAAAARSGADDRGEFIAGSHSHAALTRAYKLYMPPGASGRSLPLVVMLHGCTQDPDDFATGTGMNERAREMGFYVLYPAQSADANASRCWNWFKHNHQQRGSGEPALIADLTRTLCKQHDIDARRVFIAGLSAGGAMAAIAAAAYPELFAAAGVHSGLARGSARSVAEALQVMRSGAALARTPASTGATTPAPPVPTIVFHGDQDTTVHPRNGEQVVADALAHAPGSSAADAGSAAASAGPTPPAQVEHGTGSHGRRYTRTRHAGDSGQAAAEHWVVHGAGHAWSGGQPGGSFTDAHGPDATREMLRFFFEHAQRP